LDQYLSELMYLLAKRLSDFGEPSPENLTEALRINQLAISLLGNQAPNAYSDQHIGLLELSGQASAAKATKAHSANEGPLRDLDRYLEAVSALEDHDYKQALDQLQLLRDAQPLDPALWLLAGNAQASLNELAGAEACYSTCIGLLPKSYIGHFYRGRCRLDQGDLTGALRDFDRVLELQPGLTAALLNRALIFRAQQNYEQAEQELTRAIDTDNVSTRAYFLRADTRERLNDPVGAQQDRAEGLERTPTDELAWIARGTARLKDDPHGALRDFEAALRINPVAHSAARNSVYILIEVLDQKEKALEQLGRMLEADPNDKVALAARAVLQARMGRRTESLQDVGMLLRNDPTPKFVFQAACALALTSQVEPNDARRAATLLAQSFRRDPTLVKLATSDPDLDPIRDADDFKTLIKAAKEIEVISLVR
jgi:tetratricopeptide (TPR) repeat protein